MINVSLRHVSLDDLEVLEEWYAQIKGTMYMSRYLPKKFNGTDTNKNHEYTWYIIKANETDCGVVWLEKDKENNDVAILGILIGKLDYFGKGIGKKAIILAIKQSRDELSFNKVSLNVRKTNNRAIRCYQKCGFHINGEGEKTVSGGDKIEFFKMFLDL